MEIKTKQAITASAYRAYQASLCAVRGITFKDWIQEQQTCYGRFWGAIVE